MSHYPFNSSTHTTTPQGFVRHPHQPRRGYNTSNAWNSITKTKEWSDTPVEHSDAYKIVIVLDESSSMGCISEKMVSSLNDLICEQKTVDRACKFTLVKFNENVQRVVCSTNLAHVEPLTSSTYHPNGTTALYDAVGDTINWFRYESNVLLVVITDGQENASSKYRKEQVLQMLKEKEQHRGWSSVYLGCDLSIAAQGDTLGFKRSKQASNCCVAQSEYGNFVSNDLSDAIKNHRVKGVSVQYQLNRKF